MREEFSREIRSTVTSERYRISIVKSDKPKPSEDEVLIKVEACPINPSDLGLLISFAADLDTVSVSGSGNATVAKMKIHEGLMKQMKPRLGKSMKVGNEGGGLEDAGAKFKHLIGKTVGLAGGAMYSRYRCVKASSCLVMNDDTTTTEATSSFVNPNCVGLHRTMKLENHSALINTAAASALGQMLVKFVKLIRSHSLTLSGNLNM